MLFNVFKAVLARGLFAVHGFVSVWRVVDIKGGDPSYWLLATSIGLLVCEGVFSICKRRGREMKCSGTYDNLNSPGAVFGPRLTIGQIKWFCPSVFFYLCCIIPPTWIMELDLAQTRKAIRQARDAGSQFVTRREKLSKIPGLHVAINLELSAELWAKVLEQFLLVNLIIGRWLLPKGDLTRGQLSQLLLVYIGMAADIVELFEAFKEDAVSDNVELTYAVLALWSWSLMQFTLVLTATKARKPRLGVDNSAAQSDHEGGAAATGRCPTLRHLRHMDTWAILTTILFQDGPFLCLRLLLITKYNVVSYLNIFFTCKNSLVLLLQMYRMTVVSCEGPKVATTHHKDHQPTDAESGTEPVGFRDRSGDYEAASHRDQWSPNWHQKDRPASHHHVVNRDGFATEDERGMKKRIRGGDYDDLPNYVDLTGGGCEDKAESTSKIGRKLSSRHGDQNHHHRDQHALLTHSKMFEDRDRDSVFVAYSQSHDAPWSNVYLTLSPGSRSKMVEEEEKEDEPEEIRMRRGRVGDPGDRCCRRNDRRASGGDGEPRRSCDGRTKNGTPSGSAKKKVGHHRSRQSGFGDRKCGMNRMRGVPEADWLLEHCFREESACASTRF